MYGCESWTIKKAEHRRIDAFELWCWRRLLRVPWTARRSNQSVLKEISPGCSLEGLMVKLKLQYGEAEAPILWLSDAKRKTLMLGKIEGKRRRRQQKIRWLDHITDSVVMNLSKLWKIVKDREAWCVAVYEVAELGMTWRLNNNSILQAKIHFTLSRNFPLNIFSGAYSYIVLRICAWGCFLSKYPYDKLLFVIL